VTNAQLQHLKQIAGKGLTLKEMANTIGVSMSNVRTTLIKHRLPPYENTFKYDINKLKQGIEEGLNYTALAEYMGISFATLKRVLAKEGISLEAKPQIDVELLRQLCEQGLNVSQISKKMELSYSTIYTTAETHNIQLNKWARTPQPTSPRDLRILELRSQGLSYRAIGQIVGISFEAVRQILKKHNANGRIKNLIRKNTSTTKAILLREAFEEQYSQILLPLHQSGKSLYAISVEWQVSLQLVTWLFNKLNGHQHKQQLRTQRLDTIKTLRLQGLTLKQIAAQLNCSLGGIFQILYRDKHPHLHRKYYLNRKNSRQPQNP